MDTKIDTKKMDTKNTARTGRIALVTAVCAIAATTNAAAQSQPEHNSVHTTLQETWTAAQQRAQTLANHTRTQQTIARLEGEYNKGDWTLRIREVDHPPFVRPIYVELVRKGSENQPHAQQLWHWVQSQDGPALRALGYPSANAMAQTTSWGPTAVGMWAAPDLFPLARPDEYAPLTQLTVGTAADGTLTIRSEQPFPVETHTNRMLKPEDWWQQALRDAGQVTDEERPPPPPSRWCSAQAMIAIQRDNADGLAWSFTCQELGSEDQDLWNVGTIEFARTGDTPNAVRKPSGVVIIDLRAGEGVSVETGQSFQAHVDVRLTYGTLVSSTRWKGRQPIIGKHPLYKQMLPGMVEAVQGMAAPENVQTAPAYSGSLRRALVPPNAGFGEEGSTDHGIPRNASLIVDVEVRSVRDNAIAAP